MKKTNFDRYLEEQLKDPAFAERYERAGEAWDVALQLTALREQAGLSQSQLARLLRTTQQQVSRLESPAYEGHSLSMLRRVAAALHARVRVVLEPLAKAEKSAVVREEARRVAEPSARYRTKRRMKKS
jgi:transcriptional regulator with XRE-family HTH domain